MKCACGRELTTGDGDGRCVICRNYIFVGPTEEVGAVSMSPSTLLLADLDWLIHEIERGDHIAWDGDDFLRLLDLLRRVHGFIITS